MSTSTKLGEAARPLKKSKGAYSVSVPIDFVRILGWKESQKVTIKLEGTKLTIRDWRK